MAGSRRLESLCPLQLRLYCPRARPHPLTACFSTCAQSGGPVRVPVGLGKGSSGVFTDKVGVSECWCEPCVKAPGTDEHLTVPDLKEVCLVGETA